MPLQIKVGHRYRTRSGDVVEIVGTVNNSSYPLAGRVMLSYGEQYLQLGDIELFTREGRYAVQAITKADLIEELPADAPHSLQG